jgi:hypothetical protein
MRLVTTTGPRGTPRLRLGHGCGTDKSCPWLWTRLLCVEMRGCSLLCSAEVKLIGEDYQLQHDCENVFRKHFW